MGLTTGAELCCPLNASGITACSGSVYSRKIPSKNDLERLTARSVMACFKLLKADFILSYTRT